MLHLPLFSLIIQVFCTPEGMLSSEQGVYVAESIAAKNTKQAKGRFRMYEDQNDTVLLHVSSLLLLPFSFFSPSFVIVIYNVFVFVPGSYQF
jgi:hypothetical protein